jgi:hypothetical protein
MTILEFGRRLDPQSWTDAFQRNGLRFDNGSAGKQVHIDLSDLGFADFVSLGHLLVFARSLRDTGVGYSVRWPMPDLRPTDDPQDPEAAIDRIRRNNCRLYLEQAGAINVLKSPPSNALPGSPVGPQSAPPKSTTQPSGQSGDLDRALLPHRHRRILPYRWVTAKAASQLTQTTRPSWLEVELRDLGLASETAAALAKGILAELLENGAEHAGASAILLGGVIVQPDTYLNATRISDFEPDLRDVASRTRGAGSPLVRLVVADAGWGTGKKSDPGAGRPKILDALDNWSATVEAGPKGGARGLWKVSRIVRAYEGGLLISSGGETVGRVFDESGARTVERETAAVLPGTFVQCALPSRPGIEALRPAGEVPTPRKQSAGSRSSLACIAVNLYYRKGFDEKEIAEIRALLGNLPTGKSGLVVTANVKHGGDAQNDVEIELAIRQCLTIAAETSGTATLSLAFPSINRPLMSVAVEHVNAGYSTALPMLVLAPENRHYWVGGSPAHRRVLTALSGADDPVRVDQISLQPAEDLAATRDLIERADLLHVGGEQVTLRLRPQDAVTAMASYVADRIRRGIAEADPPCVWRGRFLTPSLRVTNQWCDPEALLGELGLAGLAGFSLAARVEDRLGRIDQMPSRPLIVRLDSIPRDTMTAFARSLHGRDEHFDSLDDTRLEQTGARPGSGPVRILLVTGLISSRTTVTRALNDAAAREMVPIGVAALIDARDATTIQNDADELAFQGSRVPLIKLLAVDIEPDEADPDPRKPTPIDPILGQPIEKTMGATRPLLPQAVYVEALKRSSAARLGHIERPANRHYTAYVDPTLLFRDERWSARVMGRIARQLDQRHREVFGARAADAPLCLLYPEGTTDDLRAVTKELFDMLAHKGVKVEMPVAVPRATYVSRWWLPRLLLLPSGTRHAVFIDSGASSGHTIQQSIRLSAYNEVEAITGILLLNGLSDSEALNLQQVAAVRRPHGSEVVPLELYFVARTATSSVDRKDCAICALRRRYARLSLLVPIPESLERHRDWLVKILEPRTKQNLFEVQATDLFGANVSQRECVEYLQWRFDLRQATYNTDKRLSVTQKLDAAKNDPLLRDALIRLLVAESQWLRSAPLWFPACRQSIADLVVSLLIGDSAMSTDQMLRIQALILLSDAAPDRFARELIPILEANRHQEPVVSHVFLEALRLIVDPSAPTSYARALVTQPLVQALIQKEGELRRRGSLADSKPFKLSLVRYVLSHGRRPLQPVPTNPQAAWAALRSYRGSLAEHNYANEMWRIVTSIGIIGRGSPPADLDGIHEDWMRCLNFLLLDVLPNANLLRQVLTSKAILNDMVPGDAVRWERAINGGGAKMLDETAAGIANLLDQIEPGGQANTYSVGSLLDDLRFWSTHFLRADALLANVVDRCPADLVMAVRESLQGTDATLVGQGAGDYWVFCTTRLLRDVFTHIRINAEETHRAKGTNQTFEACLEEPAPGRVTVTVRNTGSSKELTGGGKGIETLQRRLGGFGGSLEEVSPGEGWSYAIAVTLDRWRMPI